MRLSKEERQAVEDLKNLAKRWPKSLGLFSDGTLYVMKLGPDRNFVMREGRTPWGPMDKMDPDYIVDRINDIKTDGGDPW